VRLVSRTLRHSSSVKSTRRLRTLMAALLNQDVNLAESGRNGGGERCDLRLIGDIGRKCSGIAARRAQSGGSLFDRPAAARDQRHLRAGSRQGRGDGLAEPLAGPVTTATRPSRRSPALSPGLLQRDLPHR